MTLVETRLRKALDKANKEIKELRNEVKRLSADICPRCGIRQSRAETAVDW